MYCINAVNLKVGETIIQVKIAAIINGQVIV